MLKIQIMKVDIYGKSASQSKKFYFSALPMTKRAFEMAMASLLALDDIAVLKNSHWFVLRRVLESHLMILSETSAKDMLSAAVTKVDAFLTKQERIRDEKTSWALRNLRLHRNIMQATLLLMQKKELTEELKAELEHAKDHPELYEDGRRTEACIVLGRERYR